MSDFSEKRKYQRCTSSACKAFINEGGKHHRKLDIRDVSAGGIRFSAERELHSGDKVKVRLVVYYALSEFKMDFEGIIVRQEMVNGQIIYAVQFINVEQKTRVQLDEVLRSAVDVKESKVSVSVYNEDVLSTLRH